MNRRPQINNQRSKKRVLFVDDEPRILDGLRRMLRPVNNIWDMEFATSGPSALAVMDQCPFDVIVSDMRMPEMDGAELLGIARKLYPRTIRFVLSGYSDKEMVLKTIGPTHQFLAKPCDTDVLIRAIVRATATHDAMGTGHIAAMISGIESLPTIPELHSKLAEVLESPGVSVEDVSRVLRSDISVAAKILHLANSTFFGSGRIISSVDDAVAHLGIETIKTILLTTGVFSKFGESTTARFAVRDLYRHCMNVGSLAAKIAQTRTSERKAVNTAITAGLLHDIGKLIFIANRTRQYDEVYRTCQEERRPLYEVEETVFGTNHAEVGGYLMDLWGLPEEITDAISLHHRPSDSLNNNFGALTAVHVADVLEHELWAMDEEPCTVRIDKEYLASTGVEGMLPEWRQTASACISKTYRCNEDAGK